MKPFEKKILDFAALKALLPKGAKVLLAVSGGADSIALMCALKSLKDAGAIDNDLSVAHINHNLRAADSDGDMGFVIRLADKLDLQFDGRSVDVNDYAKSQKLSIETAARDLRIEHLIDIANRFGCDRIATAHHADDNAETMTHRLMRGTGYRGLCGIQPKNTFSKQHAETTFIRPMLCVTKNEIIEYCNDNKIDWRHDHTNDEYDYTRNRIRHLLLPQLQKNCTRPIAQPLAELSAACQKLYLQISAEIDKLQSELFTTTSQGQLQVPAKILGIQPPILQVEIIRRALTMIGCGQRHITQTHYNQIISLLDGPGAKTIELPAGFKATLRHANIIFYDPADSKFFSRESDAKPVEIKIPGTVKFAGSTITATVLPSADCNIEKFKAEKTNNIEWFDLDKIDGPIIARRREPGDVFMPIGMNTNKKIGKFLTANQTAYSQRNNLIVIQDKQKILWLAPIRPSQQTRIKESTNRILQLKISPESS